MTTTEKKPEKSGNARRPTGLIWIAVVAGAALLVLLAAWVVRSRPAQGRGSQSLRTAVSALAANPAEYARNHINGGVGAVLMMDATGRTMVMGVNAGSPAEKAGLHKGDVITEVNGVTTTGQTLQAVVEKIRGFSLGSVAITVRRGQTNGTNLEFMISRESMSSLLQSTNIVP